MAVLAAGESGCDEPGDRSGGGSGTDASLFSEVADGGEEATSLFDIPPDTLAPPDTGTPEEVDDGPAPIVSASCVDGRYDEPPPSDLAALDDLVAGYVATDYLAFADQVLARRYPFGATLVRGATADGGGAFGNCVTRFTSNRGTARGLLPELSTVVHECGHVYDLSRGTFTTDHYAVGPGVSFTCQGGDTATRGGDTFARSLLNGDAYAAMYPGDFYRDVYLDGDPEDAVFDGGDQGFNSVLEEATQYVNSLVTDWTLREYLGSFSVSARDGILTFLWYIERYLLMARTSFPAAYARLSEDACWREAILTVWGRAWHYLDLTADLPALGLDDDIIEELVVMPALLEEIERLRDRHQCP